MIFFYTVLDKYSFTGDAGILFATVKAVGPDIRGKTRRRFTFDRQGAL